MKDADEEEEKDCDYRNEDEENQFPFFKSSVPRLD